MVDDGALNPWRLGVPAQEKLGVVRGQVGVPAVYARTSPACEAVPSRSSATGDASSIRSEADRDASERDGATGLPRAGVPETS